MVHYICDKCSQKIEHNINHCKVSISMTGAFDPVESKTLDLCRKCEMEFIAYAKLRIIYDDY